MPDQVHEFRHGGAGLGCKDSASMAQVVKVQVGSSSRHACLVERSPNGPALDARTCRAKHCRPSPPLGVAIRLREVINPQLMRIVGDERAADWFARAVGRQSGDRGP